MVDSRLSFFLFSKQGKSESGVNLHYKVHCCDFFFFFFFVSHFFFLFFVEGNDLSSHYQGLYGARRRH